MEGLVEIRAEHARPTGCYSSEVMTRAIDTTSMQHAGKIEYTMSLEPLSEKPDIIRECVGVVVNVHNKHWVALRYHSGTTWLLDSQEQVSQMLSETEYKMFIRKYENTFLLVAA